MSVLTSLTSLYGSKYLLDFEVILDLLKRMMTRHKIWHKLRFLLSRALLSFVGVNFQFISNLLEVLALFATSATSLRVVKSGS